MLQISCVDHAAELELDGEESFGSAQEAVSTLCKEAKLQTPAMEAGKAGVNTKPFYRV